MLTFNYVLLKNPEQNQAYYALFCEIFLYLQGFGGNDRYTSKNHTIKLYCIDYSSYTSKKNKKTETYVQYVNFWKWCWYFKTCTPVYVVFSISRSNWPQKSGQFFLLAGKNKLCVYLINPLTTSVAFSQHYRSYNSACRHNFKNLWATLFFKN